MLKTKAAKHFGRQSCDCCGRDFTVRQSSEWSCPYCGFDNRAGVEFAHHAASIGGKRAAEAKKLQAKADRILAEALESERLRRAALQKAG